MDTLPQDVVLAVNDLRTHFVFRDRSAKSVDGVTFTLTNANCSSCTPLIRSCLRRTSYS